ncbi:MAG TPA: hypothetical protein VFN10_19535 [Thermoanaerobaculia bacterium]|nr:hypothetical protein [Thermoanaerobaculia bacterium]
MKEITLPVLPHDTPPRVAIAVMHLAQRSGVVTKVGYSVRLVRARDLLDAPNAASLADVEGVELSLTVAQPFRVERTGGHDWTRSGGGLGMVMPYDWTRFQDVFDTSAYDYALHRLDVGAAVIITRSEDYEADLNGEPVDCYCAGPRHHGYSQPHPGICPRDNNPIRCW